MSSWPAYLAELSGDATGAAIARRLGVSDSKVSYWKRGERPPTILEAVRVAHAYGRSPLESLIAAGYLTSEDVADVGATVVNARNLSSFSDTELAAEMLRRAQRRSRL